MTKQCEVDGCFNQAERGRGDEFRKYCYGHRKRKQRNQTVNAPLVDRPRTPTYRLDGANLEMADLRPSDDNGWRRARDNLHKSAVRYTLALPKFKPLMEYLAKVNPPPPGQSFSKNIPSLKPLEELIQKADKSFPVSREMAA